MSIVDTRRGALLALRSLGRRNEPRMNERPNQQTQAAAVEAFVDPLSKGVSPELCNRLAAMMQTLAKDVPAVMRKANAVRIDLTELAVALEQWQVTQDARKEREERYHRTRR